MQYIIQLFGDTICHENWKVDGKCDYYKFYYMKGGEATYTDSNKIIHLKPNRLYIFPCNDNYTITHNPQYPFDVLWFHVSFFVPYKISTTEIVIENDTMIYHLIKSLIYSIEISQAVVTQLFSVLFDIVCPFLEIILIDRTEIGQVLNYINSNLNAVFSNKQLADMLGYSEKYFIRLFKKKVGIQPHKYITRVKLGYATKFLIEGKSVKEAAEMLGYSTANNFSRDFKLYYKLSPNEYVKTYSFIP